MLVSYESNKGTIQPKHLHSLIRSFSVGQYILQHPRFCKLANKGPDQTANAQSYQGICFLHKCKLFFSYTHFFFFFRFSNYIDILTAEEEEEITREKNVRDNAFTRLAKRECELAQIRDGEIMSAKKPKSTNYTKSVAFKNYMKMYYDKPRPTVSLTLSMLVKISAVDIFEYFSYFSQKVGFGIS